MRFLFWALLAVALWGGSVFAQTAPERQGNIPGYLTPAGHHCQLSVTSGAAVSLSSCTNGIPAGALVSYIYVETAAIRWLDDGNSPTTADGMPVAAGAFLTYSGWQGAIQFIAQSSTATIDVAFYK